MQPKILLVEDDTSLSQLYKVELELKGYQVIIAADGQEGLDLAAKEKPDLVLLDVMMPKLNGLEALKRLKDNPETESIPVVVITNFGQEDIIKGAFDAGASDLVLKYQITPAELADKIKTIMAPVHYDIPEGAD
ncbi:response regulator [Candidatus Daviesbacteria bacterium]|nr:response regulator [Candidatus Daviesbacteria bacterium]